MFIGIALRMPLQLVFHVLHQLTWINPINSQNASLVLCAKEVSEIPILDTLSLVVNSIIIHLCHFKIDTFFTDQSLNTKQACANSSDTVCGPLEGFYCINQNQKGSCRLAVKHSTCRPGQYINQTGRLDVPKVILLRQTYSNINLKIE